MKQKTPRCEICGKKMFEHVGVCVVCREESHEYNPTPAEIAAICAELRVAADLEMERMFLSNSPDMTYAPRIFKISRFHKS